MRQKIILFIIFCIFFAAGIEAKNPINTDIENLAKKFLNALQKTDTSKIKNILSAKIKLTILDEKKILKITDDMMVEKISVFEYMTQITGHNIQQFLQNTLQLLQVSKVQDFGMESSIKDENIKGDFYYIKFKISYKNKNTNKTISHRLIELDIIKENNKFKIFGFII